MKKSLFITTATIIFLVIVFQSCEKQEMIDIPNSEDFNYVGEVHNLGLQQSFENLKTLAFKNKSSVVDIIQQQDSDVITKFLTQNIDSVLLSLAIEQKNLMKDELIRRIDNEMSTNGIVLLDSVIENTNMSREQRIIFTDIADINRDMNLTCNSKIEQYNLLYNKAEGLISDVTELSVVYAVINMTVASSSYWHEHYDDWRILFESNNKTPLGNVAGADVAGAICGGLGGAVVGGVGAGPGALGGGLLGSLASCINELWNW